MEQSHIEVFSPATGEKIGEVRISSRDDVIAAFERARDAQKEWAARSLKDRCAVIRRVKDVMIERTDDICDLLTQEQGKPRMEGMVHDVANLVDLMHYFTKNAERILAPEPIPLHLFKHRASYLHWVPRGVVGVIGPWNFPFNICNGPAITALIAGNGVVIKPSEYTPMIQDLSRELFIAGGVPEDLFQVVHGYADTGRAVIDHADMIEFTGSLSTGRKVAAQCGERLIPCVAELGGKAPALVLHDAHVERTANALTWGAFANCGQVCASIERLLVHSSVLPSLLDRLVPNVAALKPGHAANDPSIQMGPLNNERQRDIVHSRVQDAVAKGAKVLLGGKPIEGPGHFFEPTILIDVTPDMDVANLETFGPVLPIMVIDDESEMIQEANRVELGLLAYVFSRDTDRARKIADQIEAGTVMVNDVLAAHGMPETPWGGVKASGLGHTHGDDSLRHMCQQRHVNYDRMPWLVRDPLWFPYKPAMYRILKKLLQLVFLDGLRRKINALRR